jgi:hypothetical protein
LPKALTLPTEEAFLETSASVWAHRFHRHLRHSGLFGLQTNDKIKIERKIIRRWGSGQISRHAILRAFLTLSSFVLKG